MAVLEASHVTSTEVCYRSATGEKKQIVLTPISSLRSSVGNGFTYVYIMTSTYMRLIRVRYCNSGQLTSLTCSLTSENKPLLLYTQPTTCHLIQPTDMRSIRHT